MSLGTNSSCCVTTKPFLQQPYNSPHFSSPPEPGKADGPCRMTWGGVMKSRLLELKWGSTFQRRQPLHQECLQSPSPHCWAKLELSKALQWHGLGQGTADVCYLGCYGVRFSTRAGTQLPANDSHGNPVQCRAEQEKSMAKHPAALSHLKGEMACGEPAEAESPQRGPQSNVKPTVSSSAIRRKALGKSSPALNLSDRTASFNLASHKCWLFYCVLVNQFYSSPQAGKLHLMSLHPIGLACHSAAQEGIQGYPDVMSCQSSACEIKLGWCGSPMECLESENESLALLCSFCCWRRGRPCGQ